MEHPDSIDSRHRNGPLKGDSKTETPPASSITVRVDPNLLQALDTRARTLGVPVEDIVRHAAEEMLRRERLERDRERQRSEPRPEQGEVSVSCDDGTTENIRLPDSELATGWRRNIFSTATKLRNDLYLTVLQEIESRPRNSPRKHLLLRQFYPDYEAQDGSWRSGPAFMLPVSKIGWLIGALQQAQDALQTEARGNRAAAREARQQRPPDEVEHEEEQRWIWTQRRGAEAWNRAQNLANKHKTGASNVGLTEHFSAWQWLALCATFGFRCPLCGIAEGDLYPEIDHWGQTRVRAGTVVHLQPHHRQPVSEGGDNTMYNILPLCAHCHSDLHGGNQISAAPDWLPTQRALSERFSPGTLVTKRRLVLRQQYYARLAESAPENDSFQDPTQPSWPVGSVVAVRPPEPLAEKPGDDLISLIGHLLHPANYGLIVEGSDVSIWRGAMADINWQTGATMYGAKETDASDLHALDEETARWYREKWTEQQQTALAAFTVGDLVRPRSARRTHYSQIIEILPPEPVLLIPARAIIRNMTGKSKRQTIELVELVKASGLS